jgi:hypothetical protein
LLSEKTVEFLIFLYLPVATHGHIPSEETKLSKSSRRHRRLLDKGARTSTCVPQQENGFASGKCVQRHVYGLNACGYKTKGLVVLGRLINDFVCIA